MFIGSVIVACMCVFIYIFVQETTTTSQVKILFSLDVVIRTSTRQIYELALLYTRIRIIIHRNII